MPAAAVRAELRLRLGEAAVVTVQAAQLRVLDQAHRAAWALDRLAAVPAEQKGGGPAPVQEQDRLLARFQRPFHDLDQAPGERQPVAALGLLAHVDQLDRRRYP